MQKRELIGYSVLSLAVCISGYLIYSQASDLSENTEIKSDARVIQNDQKIDDSVSSSDFKAVQARSGMYDAFSVERGDKIYLILKKEGKETIVDQGDAKLKDDLSNISESKNFSELAFSPDGKYLLYSADGYEWLDSYVYDIAAGKNALEGDGVSMSRDGFSFTPDDKYFYMCSSNEMSGSIPGEVYVVPGFRKIFDASKGNEDYPLGKCSYDQNTNAVVFKLDNPQQGDGSPLRTKTVKYSLNKDAAANANLR